MSSRSEVLTPALLREWPLPRVDDSKYGRGDVLVVGGARSTPGAVLLAGMAALRMGAGRLSLGASESVAVGLAIALPEAGVTGLAETSAGAVRGEGVKALADSVASADALLIGPGLDDGEETAKLLGRLTSLLGEETKVVLDAYALGALAELGASDRLSGRLVLTPNPGEAEMLLEAEVGSGPEEQAEADVEIARRYGAAVSLQGVVADTDANTWHTSTGHGGLATSGSGDVLAGSVTGLVARGATLAQAACWANICMPWRETDWPPGWDRPGSWPESSLTNCRWCSRS
jgi:ADP-dependent NAD(P)H-hydrate dehydratase